MTHLDWVAELKEKSDSELVRLAGEKVMSWTFNESDGSRQACWEMDDEHLWAYLWNPVGDFNDVAQLRRRIRSLGIEVRALFMDAIDVQISPNHWQFDLLDTCCRTQTIAAIAACSAREKQP